MTALVSPHPETPRPDMPDPQDVLAARARIAPHVARTPVLRNAELDRLAGHPVLVKAECLQRTGSFKLRGATNALRSLPGVRGVVTYSSGNHGQAVACAAAALGIPATVFMPADAPRVKADATRRWGATILPFDRRHDDRAALARAHADAHGLVVVPPFDHPAVIAGQGTLALELIEDAGCELSALVVPTGGGGLIAGCGLAMQAVSPHTAIHAVEPAGWHDTALSLQAGRRMAAPGGSGLCDSLLTPQPGAITFAVNRRHIAHAWQVTDDQVLAAMRFAFLHLKLVVEPGGAVALAALLAGLVRPHGPTGVVISGGNVDAAVFASALTPALTPALAVPPG